VGVPASQGAYAWTLLHLLDAQTQDEKYISGLRDSSWSVMAAAARPAARPAETIAPGT
jgi:hypothetical protein